MQKRKALPDQRSGPIDRRSVLKIGAGLVTGAALGFPHIARAQSDKILIGHLTPMTGFLLGALGNWAVLGIHMAAEEINAAGGVMSRPLQVFSEDSIKDIPNNN